MFGKPKPIQPDPEVVRLLAGLLQETGLTTIEYAVGDHRIRVVREPTPHGHSFGSESGQRPPSLSVAQTPIVVASADEAHPGCVKSPIPGIAYLASKPGAAPFVRVGDRVSEGQTLIIVEAMKMFNEIPAPRAGTVTKICVHDGKDVDRGAPLMLIE